MDKERPDTSSMNKIETLEKWNTALQAKWPTSISNSEKFGKVMCRLPNRVETQNDFKNLLLATYPYTDRAAVPARWAYMVGQPSGGCRSNTWAPDLALPLPTSVLLIFLSISLARKIKILSALLSLQSCQKGQTREWMWNPFGERYYPHVCKSKWLVFLLNH